MALKLEVCLGISAALRLSAQRQHKRTLAYQKAKRELKRLNISETKRKELSKVVA